MGMPCQSVEEIVLKARKLDVVFCQTKDFSLAAHLTFSFGSILNPGEGNMPHSFPTFSESLP